jgi:hypothetical protein
MKKFSAMLPSFSRDTGGDILNVVRWSSSNVLLTDESAFEFDDLFCEGVYEVNYNNNKFVSKFGGVVVEFPLNALPDSTTYLNAFITARAEKDLELPIDTVDVLL